MRKEQDKKNQKMSTECVAPDNLVKLITQQGSQPSDTAIPLGIVACAEPLAAHNTVQQDFQYEVPTKSICENIVLYQFSLKVKAVTVCHACSLLSYIHLVA